MHVRRGCDAGGTIGVGAAAPIAVLSPARPIRQLPGDQSMADAHRTARRATHRRRRR
jgi:hypothetical protein